MQIGAILTLPGGRRSEADLSRSSSNYFTKELFGTSRRMLTDILGKSLLDRTLDKVRQLESSEPALISEASPSNHVLPSNAPKNSGYTAAWESAINQHLRNGVNLLLLIRMSAYQELDYTDLIRFHLERGAPITQAYRYDSPLDVAIVSASAVRGSVGPYRQSLSKLISQQQRYSYTGYLNRLSSPQEFRALVEAGLRGECGLHPVGTETHPMVWYGEGAQVDGSAAVSGPAFIGSGARVSAYSVVSGATSIERNSEIDCGTTVEESSVLADSYVGVGLHVKRAIVANQRLFHLDRHVEVGFGDHTLIGATAKTSASLASLRASLRS